MVRSTFKRAKGAKGAEDVNKKMEEPKKAPRTFKGEGIRVETPEQFQERKDAFIGPTKPFTPPEQEVAGPPSPEVPLQQPVTSEDPDLFDKTVEFLKEKAAPINEAFGQGDFETIAERDPERTKQVLGAVVDVGLAGAGGSLGRILYGSAKTAGIANQMTKASSIATKGSHYLTPVMKASKGVLKAQPGSVGKILVNSKTARLQTNWLSNFFAGHRYAKILTGLVLGTIAGSSLGTKTMGAWATGEDIEGVGHNYDKAIELGRDDIAQEMEELMIELTEENLWEKIKDWIPIYGMKEEVILAKITNARAKMELAMEERQQTTEGGDQLLTDISGLDIENMTVAEFEALSFPQQQAISQSLKEPSEFEKDRTREDEFTAAAQEVAKQKAERNK
jgi:hypothetical protein|tara:strand:- start:3674 stop:4849 length:1176 start_codon:yes stop_codon:yes gene_type:complete